MIITKRTSASLSIAAGLLIGAATAANAWTTSGDVTGPNGATYHYTSSGSCANGSCSSKQTVTGPAGGTYTRQGTISCANGTCNSSATVTGPLGGTWTRNSTISR
jgi:hypothetical protein